MSLDKFLASNGLATDAATRVERMAALLEEADAQGITGDKTGARVAFQVRLCSCHSFSYNGSIQDLMFTLLSYA